MRIVKPLRACVQQSEGFRDIVISLHGRTGQEVTAMADDYHPKPEHKFSFGLWTVGNPGRDAFGNQVRKTLSPVEIVHLLAEVGTWGVNFHNNDLVPIDAMSKERNQIVASFKAALDQTGVVVPVATTKLHGGPSNLH